MAVDRVRGAHAWHAGCLTSAQMEPPQHKPPLIRRDSGIRLRPELIEAMPPAARATPVVDAMEQVALIARSDMEAVELLRLFVDRGVHAVPVVDSAGELTGVVSKMDVLSELCGQPDTPRDRDFYASDTEASAAARRWERRSVRRVRDFMMPLSVVVTEETSVFEAASIMANQGIHPVPVVNTGGRVTGILTSSDVLRWLARNGAHQV
jgi:CBS-domain-containing membrane protein